MREPVIETMLNDLAHIDIHYFGLFNPLHNMKKTYKIMLIIDPLNNRRNKIPIHRYFSFHKLSNLYCIYDKLLPNKSLS